MTRTTSYSLIYLYPDPPPHQTGAITMSRVLPHSVAEQKRSDSSGAHSFQTVRSLVLVATVHLSPC